MAIALGRTPSEFRDTATYPDYLDLLAYMKRYGPLDLGLRAEGHAAMLAVIANNAAGGKRKFHDFAPHFERPDDKVATEDDMKRMFRVKES